MPKVWDAAKLIDAVEHLTPSTPEVEAEGLLLAICTKLKNNTPIPRQYAKVYHRTWHYVMLTLWRNT